jgi:hypothetical protein
VLTSPSVWWALTLNDPPGETTHWTADAMAKLAGVSVSSVQRIWRSHGLQPHRVRQFKLSKDPQFPAKVRDIVGLYIDPPAHAIVVSVDEKSQIQALDRTQPGLPLKKGRAGTMTRDHKTLRLDRRSRQDYRRRQARPPSAGPSPLARRPRVLRPCWTTAICKLSGIGSRPLARRGGDLIDFGASRRLGWLPTSSRAGLDPG